MENDKENILDLEVLAQRLDTDPELKGDIVIKPLWDKLVIKTQAVIEKERKLASLRQGVGEDRGAAKALLELIEERVQELDIKEKKESNKKKQKRDGDK
jgi:hypothetical protein